MPLIESEWTLGAGTNWLDLLSNVTLLRIDVELFENIDSPSTRDKSGVGNVRLVPEPSTGLLAVTGLLALSLGRRRS